MYVNEKMLIMINLRMV